MKIKYYILLFGFTALISFPIINGILQILPDTAQSENRKIKPFPAIDTCKIEAAAEIAEKYLTDHFSLRNRIIKLYNKLNIFVFKSSPISIKAIVGN